jgi:hypothetical protein
MDVTFKPVLAATKPYPTTNDQEYLKFLSDRKKDLFDGNIAVYLAHKIIKDGQELYRPFIDIDGNSNFEGDEKIESAIQNFLLTYTILEKLGVANRFKFIATGGTGFRAVSNILINEAAHNAFIDDVKLDMPHIWDPDTQQYLWTIVLTAGRVGEINELSWEDANFKERYLTLWTRKRKGGSREPRNVPMVQKLYDILWNRFEKRSLDMPWVFWHTYWDRKLGQNVRGRYIDRKKIMKSLCKKADVKYFRFHALRHLTASILDDMGVAIGAIQRILGHQNRRTTEIYLHSIGESEREAMNKLEGVDIFGAESPPKKAAPINMHTTYWQRKVKRPSYGELKCDVELMGYVATGKKYGVSDNSIRKWLKFYRNQPQT